MDDTRLLEANLRSQDALCSRDTLDASKVPLFGTVQKTFSGTQKNFGTRKNLWDAKCFFWDGIFLETQVFG